MHSFVKRAIIPLTAAAVSLLAALLARRNLHWLWVLVVSLPMLLLGIFDWLQKSWNITRNYPVAGRIRWIFYRLRPYLRDLLKSERAVARFSTINQPDWPPPAFDENNQGTAEIRVLTEAAIRDAALAMIDSGNQGDALDLLMFYLSHRQIVEALVTAHERGVEIRVLLDPNEDRSEEHTSELQSRGHLVCGLL